jgi:tRNA-specific adenosine deaminase 1
MAGPRELGDRVAEAAHTAYARLPKTGKPAFPAEWTILAAVVLENVLPDASDRSAPLEVVALGTGSKCLGADTVCGDGTTLNDSHAEVVCRRALIAYLHAQLEQVASTGRCDVFSLASPGTVSGGTCSSVDDGAVGVPSGGGSAGGIDDSSVGHAEEAVSQEEGRSPPHTKHRRQDDRHCWIARIPTVRFHFYISQAPCGDGSIFDASEAAGEVPPAQPSMVEPGSAHGRGDASAAAIGEGAMAVTATDGVTEVASNGGAKRRRVDNAHRTGAKAVPSGESDPLGPGLQYHRVGLLRTKPGRGPATFSMSCSDKICKWGVVGCQGALLSTLIRPIYFETIVVGELYDAAALERALHDRIPQLSHLRPGYTVHRPMLLSTSVRFVHGRERADCAMEPTRKAPGPAGASVAWAQQWNEDDMVDVSNRGRKQGVPKKQKLNALKFCSRLSRAALWASFNTVCAKLRRRGPTPSAHSGQTYWAAKQQATDYTACVAALRAQPPFDGWGGYGKRTQLFSADKS